MRLRVVSACAVLVVGIAIVSAHWGDPYQWKPDSLFYEAQLLRVQGASEHDALRRVFSGPLAAPRVQEELTEPRAERRLADPAWVDYSSRFYDRRWVVPALGAAVEPWLHANALRAVSLAGFVLAGLGIYLLLAMRFAPVLSALVACGVLALPPLRYWSLLPLTDSFGVAVEAFCVAAALVAIRRPRVGLPLLAVATLALSLTRDSTIVVVAGLAWVALRQRTRVALAAFATATLASLPVPLAFGASARQLIAYTLNDFRPVEPADQWHVISSKYVTGFKGMVHDDLRYLVHHPYVGALAVVGVVSLAALRARTDATIVELARGGLVGASLLLLLAPNYTAFRLELPFVPIVVVGVAFGLERLVAEVRRLRVSAAGASP